MEGLVSLASVTSKKKIVEGGGGGGGSGFHFPRDPSLFLIGSLLPVTTPPLLDRDPCVSYLIKRERERENKFH